MIDCGKINDIVTRFTEGTDLFLVETTCSPANLIEIVIDSDTAVPIEKCVELSRAVEAEFDREKEDFELTVMSAGIGQPLQLPRQYRKHLGKTVEVVLKSGIKYCGTLAGYEEDAVTLEWQEKQTVEGKKRKQLVDVRKTFSPDEIKSTRPQINFK